MTEHAACPEPARWKGLLQGSLPDAEQVLLTGHLETCGRCQQTLEGMAAGRAAWGAAARHLGGEPGGEHPALQRALADLEAQPGAPLTQGPTDPAEEPPLDFLDPPEEPGQLGRLGHYQVHEVLGRGGMGVVLKAFDKALHRV